MDMLISIFFTHNFKNRLEWDNSTKQNMQSHLHPYLFKPESWYFP